MTPRLPKFIDPMLAALVPPFESEEHLFEIKWDGFRATAYVDDALRIVGRKKTDFTKRFDELSPLAKLPRGTVIDGEIVHLTDGRPDFAALLGQERSWSSASTAKRSGKAMRGGGEVTFVAFDLLYENFISVMPLPLMERRERLRAILDAAKLGPRLVFSDGHIGGGLALFAEVNKLALEGVMAKRLDSRYEPGQRSGAWSKFKRRHMIDCVVIGYLSGSTNGIKSLALAAEIDGELKYVGQVGSAQRGRLSEELLAELRVLEQKRPIVPCTLKGCKWVRPDILCRVSFAERTADDKLRQPVLESIHGR